ncbi:MAG: WD40 repeat domain-containing protein, partial [Pseudomonadota bacterium]
SSNAMALSRDGAMIASAGPQSSIRVLRTATAAGLQQFSQDADIAALACHPDEPLVAAADDKHNVRVWNVDTRRETAQTTLFGTRNLRFLSNGALAVNATEAVFTLAPDGAAVQRSPRYPAETVLHDRHVAVRTRDGTILVGPPDDGTPLQLDEPNAVALAFNENGRLLATVGTADTGGLLRVWDAATGDALWEAPLPSAYGARPAVDAAGSHAAYVHGRTLVYLDRTSGSSQTRAFDSSPRGLSFVLGSSRLAVLQSDALALFDANDLQAEPLRLQLDVEVIAVAFNRARDKAAITTGREITVWDLATGTRLAALGTAAFTPRLCFLAGDDALALGDHANRITVRPWRTSALVNAACNHLSRNLTRREWELYLPGVPYAATCPDLTPLTREALVADMFAEDAADAPSPPP